MGLANRPVVRRGLMLGVMTLGVFGLGGDAEAQDRPKAEAPVATSARRVPPYFGQVGLSAEQREKIYTIRARHQARIVELKKELQSASVKELAECEAVLNDAQRAQLNERRAARKANSGRSPATVDGGGDSGSE